MGGFLPRQHDRQLDGGGHLRSDAVRSAVRRFQVSKRAVQLPLGIPTDAKAEIWRCSATGEQSLPATVSDFRAMA
jgi:hypothetical protein